MKCMCHLITPEHVTFSNQFITELIQEDSGELWNHVEPHLSFPMYALLPCDKSSESRDIMYSVWGPRLNLLAAMRNFPLATGAVRCPKKDEEKVLIIKNI